MCRAMSGGTAAIPASPSWATGRATRRTWPSSRWSSAISMPAFAALVAYDGARFSGFQRQSGETGPAAAGALEAALEQLTGEATAVTAAGRTDSGVHATGQVIG